MALGKYSRVDGRRSSSSYWSTVTIVVFVALCLVGVWMMTSSSSVAPVKNVEEPAQEKKNDVKDHVAESNESSTQQQFEDNNADLPEDATKGDSGSQNEKNAENRENGEKSEEKSDEETKSDDGSNTQNDDSKTDDGDSKKEDDGSNSESGEGNSGENSNESEKKSYSDENGNKSDSDDGEKKSDSDESETKSEESSGETKDGEKADSQIEEKVDQNDNKDLEKSSDGKKEDGQSKNQGSNEVFPSGAQLELLNETTTQKGSWSTQAMESKNEKEAQLSSKQQSGYNWKLCNVTAGSDFIPCLDNLKAIKSLRSTKHYEHRERHCPEEPPACLVPLPEGYKRPIEWPTSREKVCSNFTL